MRGRSGDRLIVQDPPQELPSDAVTVLDVDGNLFYAGAKTLGQRLPSVGDAEHAVVILRLRGHGDVGSTFLNVVGRYAEQLTANSGQLLLSGVDPAVKERLARTGHLKKIGEANVFVADDILGKSTRAAFAAGQAWLERLKATGPAEPGIDPARPLAGAVRDGAVPDSAAGNG